MACRLSMTLTTASRLQTYRNGRMNETGELMINAANKIDRLGNEKYLLLSALKKCSADATHRKYCEKLVIDMSA